MSKSTNELDNYRLHGSAVAKRQRAARRRGSGREEEEPRAGDRGERGGAERRSKGGRREEGTLRQARTPNTRGAASREAEEKGEAKETPQDKLAFDKGREDTAAGRHAS